MAAQHPPWLGAFLATGLVSLLPNVLLVFMPDPSKITNSKSKWNLTNLLLCFAVGALLGDVFLHSLPHLLSEHHHHHHEEHQDLKDHCDHGEQCEASLHAEEEAKIFSLERTLVIQLSILMGFLVFFIAEKFASSFLGHDHSHNHSHDAVPVNPTHPVPSGADIKSCPAANLSNSSNGNAHPVGATCPFAALTKATSAVTSSNSSMGNMKAAGWLNLLADSMHNFTDGMAIGAAFSAGKGVAVATFISVILHEIPHEIGDFTILVQNGLR
jgi:solute carrier family 39 (zinc transporter), member 7